MKGDPFEEHDRYVAFACDARDISSEIQERIDRKEGDRVSRQQTTRRLGAELAFQHAAGRSVDDPWSQVQGSRQNQAAG